ncbi:MAG TPA: phosphoenolpyruvate--protein phosphotransferase, partial [candidate division WOR-3 bacterium]|nr:phosphoenolpyruvate--protein phosphotransferase [candidate division WOR-3 bacterium]
MISRERILRGIPVSLGFASGRVFVRPDYLFDFPETVVEPAAVAEEVERLRNAVAAARDDLQQLHERVTREMGRDFAEFISVQLAFVTDADLGEQAERFIREKTRNAEFAYSTVLKEMTGRMAGARPVLFRERAPDLFDAGARVLQHMRGDEPQSLLEAPEGSVLAARSLPPSEAALLNPDRVAGLLLETGGRTSHTAIMARAKEIPAVFGIKGMTRRVRDGQSVVVDGYRGMAVVQPTERRLRSYRDDITRYRRHRRSLSRLVDEDAVTADGRVLDLSANIEFLAEARAALDNGARGIGLFRTEYMYLARLRPPTEDEQYDTLSEVARLFDPMPVIVRTFDLGGDKVVPGYSEPNPFLGWRGLRLCFDNPEMFRDQLRAILRASAHGNVKVMFPMVSSVEELRRARLLLQQAKTELARKGTRFDENLEVGVMVETPAAAIMATRLAQDCSFLSIGSNDLTQYTLAVDRGNERVAELFDPFNPAVLQLMKQTIDAAHETGIWVGICGEFAAEPLGIMVLLGLGIDEISVAPAS